MSAATLASRGGRLRQGRRAEGQEGNQGRQPGLSGAGLQEGCGPVRGDDPGRARYRRGAPGLFLSGQQLRQPVQAGQEGGGRTTTHSSRRRSTNYQKAAETLSASPTKRTRALGKLSFQYLAASYGPDKLNDPAQGRADGPKNDSARAERPDELLRAREDLRRRRSLRSGGTGVSEGQGNAPERPRRLRAAGGVLQPPGRVRQDNRRLRRRISERPEESGSALHHRDATTGTMRRRISA